MSVVDSALDDATQDVFMVVHRRLPEFEGRAAVRTWLFEIVRRVASRYRTFANKDAARTFELPELAGATDLDEAVAHAMAREVLRAFLDELDEDRLRVFVLAEIWQLRGREIAEELGVNQNTVYARLKSARDELDRVVTRLRAREARSVLTSMRRARPSRTSRARTWRALVVGLGLPSSVPVVAAASWTTGLGWGLVGAVAGAAVVIGVAVAQPEPQRSRSAARAEAPETVVRDDDPRDEAPAVTPPAVVAGPIAEAQGGPVPVVVASEREATPRRSPDTTPTEPAVALSAEVRLVKAIASAVADGRAGASGQIARYRAEFPRGALRPEVEALAIELSCRTAPADASAAIDAFARRFPGSSLVRRLNTVCRGETSGSEKGPQKPRGPQTQPL
jgi:RNA polymerase sigma-70 factor (ECF subfamily)